MKTGIPGYGIQDNTDFDLNNIHIDQCKKIIPEKDRDIIINVLRGKEIQGDKRALTDYKNTQSWWEETMEKVKYDGKGTFSVKQDTQKRAESYEQHDNTILNEYLECIVMSYLDARIRENNPPEAYKMFKTSQTDDYWASIDYIIQTTDKNGKLTFLGIDLAMVKNENRMMLKRRKETAFCEEFCAVQEIPKQNFPRMCLQIAPYLAYSLGGECLQTIMQEGAINEEAMLENFDYACESEELKKMIKGFDDTHDSIPTMVKKFHREIGSILNQVQKPDAS